MEQGRRPDLSPHLPLPAKAWLFHEELLFFTKKANQSINQDLCSPPTHFAGEKGEKGCIFNVCSSI